MESLQTEQKYLPPIKPKKNIVGIISLSASVVLLGTTVYLASSLSNVNTRLDEVVAQNKAVVATNIENTDKITVLNDTMELMYFSQQYSSAIVTDDLVMEKFIKLESGFGIDVRNQPTMGLNYKGQGKYDLSDREVKAMVIALVDKIKGNYDDWDLAAKWTESTEVKVFILNYEMGTYKNGTFKLVGE